MTDKLNIVNECVDGNVVEEGWFYTDIVREHFFKPRNTFSSKEESLKYEKEADGVGFVGSAACGDGMKVFIKIDEDKIVDLKWETFGCTTAIASMSAFSCMVIDGGGMEIDEALKIKPKDISDYLGGIPAKKFHCSVLADKVLREALNDYFKKSGQVSRVVEKKAVIVDKVLKVCEKDIEHAVLDGARTFEEVQKKTKVGIHDKSCIPHVEELIKKYKGKYFENEEDN